MTGPASCARCGAETPSPAARFCHVCGTPLTASPAVESRKTVTALFCDVSGSTELAGRLDPEALRGLMESYFARVSSVLERHGGTVEKFIGDAVVAVFGVPVVHEDDALRCCRAALDVAMAVAALNDEALSLGRGFAVRIGVETGEVLVGDSSRGSTFATGPAVNTAARLEQAASAGEVLVGPACHRLVRDRVVVEARPGLVLKGVTEPVDAFLLIAADDLGLEPALADTPYVGRRRELSLLTDTLDRVRNDRAVALVTVLGVAGMGKSRLTAEFLGSLDDEVLVLRGRCVSYGEGVTFWPLVEIVRQVAALSGAESEQEGRAALRVVLGMSPDAGDVVERIAPVAGLGGTPGDQADTAWAVRRLLEALSRDRPLVLVVDDLHWAEPGLVALVQDVCQWLIDAPVLVLVLARPEFLDDNPGWGGGRPNTFSALLEPLAAADVGQLVGGLFGTLPDDVLSRVAELAGGNPLYVEHLLAMLVENGSLAATGEGWRLDGEVGRIEVPGSISALIAARLDRLPAEEQALLGVASVMGQVFYRGALASSSTTEQLGSLLDGLVRKGLVRPTTPDLPGQDALRFSHVLVRDAAYASLPKAVRADEHERFARWLDKLAEGPAVDDFVGGHLEAAYLARAELGEIDGATRALGLEASRRLEVAGRSLLFGADDAATALLERADRLRQDQVPARWALQLELVLAWHRNLDRLQDARPLVSSLQQAAQAAGDRRWSMVGALMAAMVEMDLSVPGSTLALREVAEAAAPVFAEVDDPFGMSLTHMALADIHQMSYDLDAATRHMQLAAQFALVAGRLNSAEIYSDFVIMYRMLGTDPLADMLADSRERLERTQHRQFRGVAAAIVGACAAMMSRPEEALQAWSVADRVSLELPGSMVPVTVAFWRGDAMVAMGRWAEASRELEVRTAIRRASESWAVLSTDAAHHAIVSLHLGDEAAARAQLREAEQNAMVDDVATHAPVRAVRSWLAAIDGDEQGSRQHAAASTTLLPDVALSERAMMHVACAEAMLVLGDREESARHRRSAIELYEQKGNVVGAARHRVLLAELS